MNDPKNNVVAKAAVIGTVAILAATVAPLLTLCAGVAAAFCAGRWIAKTYTDNVPPGGS